MNALWKRIVLEEVGQERNVHQEDHGIPLLEKYLILEEVAKFTPLGPKNKYLDPTMNRVDKYISEM